MAEQCDFYYYDSSFWSSSYCCRLLQSKGKDYRVGQDWAEEYCRRYKHEKCPYLKNASHMSDDSGCYLTSACVKFRGMPDDCRELQCLRHFRDTYLKEQPDGLKEIEEYYAIAPCLVEEINRRDDAKEIYEDIYRNLVRPCVKLIDEGKNEECHQLYLSYTKALYKEYMP